MHKDKGFSLPVVLLVILFISLFTFVSYKLINKFDNKKVDNKKVDVKDSPVVISTPKQNKETLNKWEVFKSQLGFSFQYPGEWGKPIEEISVALETGQGDSGKLYSLKFTNNNNVWASGRSKDFSAGRGGMRQDFFGDETKSAGVESYLDIVAPGCFSMGMQDTFEGVVEFNLPGKEISGVRLQMPILIQDDYWSLIKKFDIPTLKTGSLGTETLASNECYLVGNEYILEELETKGRALKEFILNKTGLSNETIKNIEIFETVSKSAQVN